MPYGSSWLFMFSNDLSNWVLQNLLGKEAANLLEVKVGGQKIIGDSARFDTDAPAPG